MSKRTFLTPAVAFAAVSFFLGQLGDGLNVFQGIYLVNIGWNEGAVGAALSLMGLTALIVQTFSGDVIDKITIDRRKVLSIAALLTSFSALAILFVREGNNNQDHMLMYVTKVVEGLASSFIAPCLAALTLASFGPEEFDSIMASNVLWGHIGSSVSAILAGAAAYILYPNIKWCFFVIAFSALAAILFVPFLPQGDQMMGRGFHNDEKNRIKSTKHNISDSGGETSYYSENSNEKDKSMEAASYISVFSDKKTLVLCLTGFFFHFANANVLLVLGELMSMENNDSNNDGYYYENDDNGKEGETSRSAIPLIAGAIILAQLTMSGATAIGDKLTEHGVGRKTIFLAGLVSLPIRCALIIYWRDAGNGFLLSTQLLDGVGGGFFGLLHPYLVADITFGTGRFNLIMGMTASCFGLGSTISNFLGQMIVEKMGHVTSLSCSLLISFIPIVIFSMLMPETMNTRGKKNDLGDDNGDKPYVRTDYVLA